MNDASRSLKSWAHLYPEWRRLYLEGFSTREIAEKFSANTMSVRVAVRDIIRSNLAEIAHEDFFENIDAPEKAYWLGLIAADGCVAERPGNQQWRIVLGLKQNNKVSTVGNEQTLVEKFKEAVGTSGEVSSTTRTDGVIFQVCLTSNRMALDLSMHGIFPLKGSDKIGIPIVGVPLELYPSLARGLLDGDGTVALQSLKLPSGYVSWNRYLQFTGQHRVLGALFDGLRRLGIIQNKVKRQYRRGTNHLCCYTNDAKRLIEAMYKQEGPWLLRKWKRAHLHPSEWEDYTGKIPPIDQVKRPTGAVVGQGRKFDYDEIRRLRGEEQLSFEEIERIVGCSRTVTVKALRGTEKMRVTK